MATPVIMPRQGQSVESCIISKWYKKKGDTIEVGDILFNYETDKATFDEESKAAGVLIDVFFEEGDEVPVLTNVCVIGKPGESTDEFNPNLDDGVAEKAETKAAEPKMSETTENKPTGVTQSANQSGEIKISPRAKNLAAKTGADERFAKPTGPYGRIIERDIIELRENGPIVTRAAGDELVSMPVGKVVQGTGIGGRITTDDLKKADESVKSEIEQNYQIKSDYEKVKLTNIRKVIAKAMHHSLANSAQLTLNASFDATDIMNYRKKLKNRKKTADAENITLNDIIVFVVSRTILNHKEINAHFMDEEIYLFKNAHIGIAVDTERGLMVPTLFDANLKSLKQISSETKALANECKEGKISPDALRGGTFTITNLGTLGIESFTPVINPPQAGILGVDNIMTRVKEINEQYLYYPAMGLSLTFDHRAIDGAPAARFLQELKNNLENFSILYAKKL
ncbi:MAG: dihydrolipoamide acetyltransferase family protein [Clostridia bacterium]|jgi:pyruvate dehydrogenase E2 component (dihydrolipoamide acetyltransferase)